MNLDTGIKESKRLEIANSLCHLLADTYTLYLKTHKYHWNVVGPMFQTLHHMFEKQYKALVEAADQIAERVRTLNVKAPGSYQEFLEMSKIKNDTSKDVEASEMIKNLLKDHEQVTKRAKEILSLLGEANDQGTSSLLVDRIGYHEKTAWMLRSLIDS